MRNHLSRPSHLVNIHKLILKTINTLQSKETPVDLTAIEMLSLFANLAQQGENPTEFKGWETIETLIAKTTQESREAREAREKKAYTDDGNGIGDLPTAAFFHKPLQDRKTRASTIEANDFKIEKKSHLTS